MSRFITIDRNQQKEKVIQKTNIKCFYMPTYKQWTEKTANEVNKKADFITPVYRQTIKVNKLSISLCIWIWFEYSTGELTHHCTQRGVAHSLSKYVSQTKKPYVDGSWKKLWCVHLHYMFFIYLRWEWKKLITASHKRQSHYSGQYCPASSN